MEEIINDLTEIQPVDWLSNAFTKTSVLRLDKVHPIVSGNKWYKLRYYLEAARTLNKKIITFGGAYSNHIIATAAACKAAGLKCTGLIRGEAPATPSCTLKDAAALGMELHFISREAYREKKIPEIYTSDAFYLVLEGGYGPKGMQGAATIPVAQDYELICCAVGTGTTMAGLTGNAGSATKVIGFSVLKNHHDLLKEMEALLPAAPAASYAIDPDYHFGGYAKYTGELIAFMNTLYKKTAIPTDFVYTGKLFYGVKQLLEQHPGIYQRVLIVHSGGLQGNRSLPKGTLIF